MTEPTETTEPVTPPAYLNALDWCAMVFESLQGREVDDDG